MADIRSGLLREAGGGEDDRSSCREATNPGGLPCGQRSSEKLEFGALGYRRTSPGRVRAGLEKGGKIKQDMMESWKSLVGKVSTFGAGSLGQPRKQMSSHCVHLCLRAWVL